MIFLVEEQPNPSSDFFVLPALRAGGEAVRRCRFSDIPSIKALQGATVVFVRYIPPAWRRLLEHAHGHVAHLVLFMDDDVLDVRASAGMPWRYRAKLWRLAARHRDWLRRRGARLWVSTPYLQQKYADWQPALVLPCPVPPPASMCRVFYHGSASHQAEIRWLRPVMETVLARDERVHFEIVGGRDVYRLYRGLPRVTVVHPMRWPAYGGFLASAQRDIGLVPQLDLPFNRARSHTKVFDITACGAAGVYSPGSACADVIAHGVDGWVVPLDQAAWAESILALAGDEALRAALAAKARETVGRLADLDSRFRGNDGLGCGE
ncbi:glycosyltransferase [Ectothiorhodospira shaposhnikovii]|uniref:glycosyltransferase n=1 Tax=Ectothiorhodospira shaposhnikovii TaxID=1054 RepID=UPI001EE7B75E|nr:glycosyltransferase [Ectothiorhodospira shaposhnikovii]MCG5514001.1 glycosyltransferase [Ectothiorhodospira shaposhnikovii]